MQVTQISELRVVPRKRSRSAPQLVRQPRPVLSRLQILKKLPCAEDGARSLVGCGHRLFSTERFAFGDLGKSGGLPAEARASRTMGGCRDRDSPLTLACSARLSRMARGADLLVMLTTPVAEDFSAP